MSRKAEFLDYERSYTVGSVAAYLLGASVIKSRFRTNYLATLGIHFVNATLIWYLSESFLHNLLEPRFVGNDQVVADLSKKYNFSVFDFAQAKKEAHLKALRYQLVKEGQSILY
jgi:hypothetical protein